MKMTKLVTHVKFTMTMLQLKGIFCIAFYCISKVSSNTWLFDLMFARLLNRDQISDEEASIDDEDDDFLKAFKVADVVYHLYRSYF